MAGKRLGFQDTRGTLFFEIARIVEIKRPRLLLLENVKGLLSHDEGRTFLTILSVLDELGYDAEWEVLNSKHFGVPQNRERVFIVGHLRGEPFREVFPLGQGPEVPAGALGEARGEGERVHDDGIVANTISQRDYKGGNQLVAGNLRAPDRDGNLIYDDFNGAFTEEVGSVRPTFGNEAGGNGVKIVDFYNHTEDTEVGTLSEGQAHRGNAGFGLCQGSRIRRLTPIECERLQGFPDNWTQGVSDTQRYKMMGNAVTVNVIEAIGEAILDAVSLTSGGKAD